MSEEQSTFKVTDRRLFNSDGSPREVASEEKPVAETTGAAAPAAERQDQSSPTAATAASFQPEPTRDDLEEEIDIPGADDPASFINFAMSLASNAAAALGMMEHPVTHKRDVDLQLAKHWIDVLGMLQEKTRGNLSREEAEILEGWLADLRMQ